MYVWVLWRAMYITYVHVHTCVPCTTNVCLTCMTNDCMRAVFAGHPTVHSSMRMQYFPRVFPPTRVCGYNIHAAVCGNSETRKCSIGHVLLPVSHTNATATSGCREKEKNSPPNRRDRLVLFVLPSALVSPRACANPCLPDLSARAEFYSSIEHDTRASGEASSTQQQFGCPSPRL